MRSVKKQRHSFCLQALNNFVFFFSETLSIEQKKLQEAKFEMMTSEASYLNSLNVLMKHFMQNIYKCKTGSKEDMDILFGKIPQGKS